MLEMSSHRNAVLLSGIGFLLLAPTVFGQAVPFQGWRATNPSAAPVGPCRQLLELTGLELSVISAELIPAKGSTPEHCQLFLLAQPELRMEVNLPTGWNGRFYMFGNGGWAGESFGAAGRVASHARALRAGFASASTDTGHSAALEPGASFAMTPQKLLDFGFRSLHVTAETAKMLVRRYYGAAPSKSYYEGCSQGGRQGLTIAQRYPNDFDGIIAGAPALYNTGNMLARAYWMRGMAENPFPAAKLGLLAERVYAKCDGADGVKDGVISDPLRCGFKAAQDLPRCAEGKNDASCFTAAEIASAERIYSDISRQGKRFFPGWPVGAEVAPPGGRSGWLGQEVRGANGESVWANYGIDFLRYMATPGIDPERVMSTFDLDKEIPRLQYLQQVIDATDPDLSAFRQRGGKLILYFGWADPQVNPRVAVEYYDQVAARMGASTGDFARLFMVPGMFHCRGGVGTSSFDMATPLLQWVEAGAAPASIPASQIASGKAVRTRPLCPHPQIARYSGSGSIDDAANFRCVAP